MKIIHTLAGAALVGLASLGVAAAPANAAPCRDAHGHFTKCPGSITAAAKPAARKAATARPAKPQAMALTVKKLPVHTAAISHRATTPAAVSSKTAVVHAKSTVKPVSKG